MLMKFPKKIQEDMGKSSRDSPQALESAGGEAKGLG